MTSGPDNTRFDPTPSKPQRMTTPNDKFTPGTYIEITASYNYRSGLWRDNSACRTMEPELWFPVTPDKPQAAVRAICYGCPARLQCLSYAVQTNQRDGIWGGVTPKNRRALRRKLYKALRSMGKGL